MMPAKLANDNSQPRSIINIGFIIRVAAAVSKMSRHGAILRPTYQVMRFRIAIMPARMIDGVKPTMVMKNRIKIIEKNSPEKRDSLPKILRAISTKIER